MTLYMVFPETTRMNLKFTAIFWTIFRRCGAKAVILQGKRAKVRQKTVGKTDEKTAVESLAQSADVAFSALSCFQYTTNMPGDAIIPTVKEPDAAFWRGR